MSDRMIMEGTIKNYHPNNEYYYDSEENYEPDLLEPSFLENAASDFSRKWYTTSQIMGTDDSGIPNGIWFELDEIPDSYISSFGAIWSFSLGRFRVPRKLYMNRPDHPYWVIYTKEGMFYLHRLMAKYFIPNPYNYPIVRHLNDNGLDCSLSNLAWGTQKDNVEDAIRNGTFHHPTRELIERGNAARRKRVIAINTKTGEEKEYPSTAAAGRACGVSQSMVSNWIRGKVKGKYKTTSKYAFRRADT